jgi:Zn-dependent protease
LWISAAGPASNLTVAALGLVAIVVLKFISPGVAVFLRSFLLGRGNLPPGFYPLEGLALILFYGVLINAYLAIFNLIPVPPLDGSGVLLAFLSDEAAQTYERIRPFGFLIVIGLVYLGVLQIIVRPIEVFILTVIFL